MEQTIDRENKSRSKKRPRICPECGSKRLTSHEDEFFCNDCDWDGVDLYARICVLGAPKVRRSRITDFED